MSQTHRQAENALQQAKDKLAQVRRIPEDDNYPVGTVIRFQQAGTWKSIIKRGWTQWVMTGQSYDMAWASVVQVIAAVEEWEVSSVWVTDYVNAPQVHVSMDGDRQYVLVDAVSGEQWIRDGDNWVPHDNA